MPRPAVESVTETYCGSSCHACDRPDDDWMIQCERSGHGKDEGWYHYSCVGVTEKALPDEWFCPLCRPRYQFLNVPGRPTVGGKGIALPSKAAVEPSAPTFDANKQAKGSKKRVAVSGRRSKTSKSGQQARLPAVSTTSKPLPRAKAALETETESETEAAPIKIPKRRWDEPFEQHAVGILMAEMLANHEKEGAWVWTDTKWPVIAKRLRERFFYARSGSCVKNWWGRHGRRMFDLDERRKPNSAKMVTSVQDPADRKRRREEKKKIQGQEQATPKASKVNPDHEELTDKLMDNRPTKRPNKRKRDEDDSSEYEQPRMNRSPRQAGANICDQPMKKSSKRKKGDNALSVGGSLIEPTRDQPTKRAYKRKRDEVDSGDDDDEPLINRRPCRRHIH